MIFIYQEKLCCNDFAASVNIQHKYDSIHSLIYTGECWLSYLSGARCRLAYGPADATATHCLWIQ